jgi:hypothetical protein
MEEKISIQINEIKRLIDYDRSKTLFEQSLLSEATIKFTNEQIETAWNQETKNFKFDSCGGNYRYTPLKNNMINEWKRLPNDYVFTDINTEVRQWISKKLLQSINDRIYQLASYGKNDSFINGNILNFSNGPSNPKSLQNICFGKPCGNRDNQITYNKDFADNPDRFKESIPSKYIIRSTFNQGHKNYHSNYIDWQKLLLDYVGTMDMCRLEDRFWVNLEKNVGRNNYTLTTKDVHNLLEGFELITGLIGAIPFPPTAILFNGISIATGVLNSGLYSAEGKNYDAAIALGFALMPSAELSRIVGGIGEEGVKNIVRSASRKSAQSIDSSTKKSVDLLNLPANAKIFSNGIRLSTKEFLEKSIKFYYENNGIVRTMKYLKLFYNKTPNAGKVTLEFIGFPLSMDLIYYLWTLSLTDDEKLLEEEKKFKSDFKPIMDVLKRPDEFLGDLIKKITNKSSENIESIPSISEVEIDSIQVRDLTPEQILDYINKLNILSGSEPLNKDVLDKIVRMFLSGVDDDTDGEYSDSDGTNEELIENSIFAIKDAIYYEYIDAKIKKLTNYGITHWLIEELGDVDFRVRAKCACWLQQIEVPNIESSLINDCKKLHSIEASERGASITKSINGITYSLPRYLEGGYYEKVLRQYNTRRENKCSWDDPKCLLEIGMNVSYYDVKSKSWKVVRPGEELPIIPCKVIGDIKESNLDTSQLKENGYNKSHIFVVNKNCSNRCFQCVVSSDGFTMCKEINCK